MATALPRADLFSTLGAKYKIEQHQRAIPSACADKFLAGTSIVIPSVEAAIRLLDGPDGNSEDGQFRASFPESNGRFDATGLYSSLPESPSMAELRTIRRATVYTDSVLESFLLEHFEKLGAKGYSVSDCRGKGKHDVLEDPRTGRSRVRIETLVKPEVGDKIMEYLSREEFKRRAVALCMESVEEPSNEDV